jgi:phospholipid/cholesterol/gamma-HCH transport system permease protein
MVRDNLARRLVAVSVRSPRTERDGTPRDEISETPKFLSALGATTSQVGDFYQMTAETVRFAFRRPFQFRELVQQAWFLVSVSLLPTIAIAIPLCVIFVFQFNQILIQLGATDLAGAGAGVAVVREIGPIVSVLAVAGTGVTAICADLGARKIREEIDAMEVLAVNPVHRLVVPRVLGCALVSLALNAVVTVVGLASAFVFSVFVQRASAGLFVSNLTLLTNASDFVVSEVKATVFGLQAGLVGCYLGINAKGGPKGVGDAVNLAVVFSFLMLFLTNSVITAVFLQYRY